jgi:hypothetical protein
MGKLKLDLHDIYNRGHQIDEELERVLRNRGEVLLGEESSSGFRSAPTAASCIRYRTAKSASRRP